MGDGDDLTSDDYPYNLFDPDQNEDGVIDDTTIVFDGESLTLFIDVSSSGDNFEFSYQWQVSTDDGLTWIDISDSGLLGVTGDTTNQFSIAEVTVDEHDNMLFRVFITAPGYNCTSAMSSEILLDVK